MKRYPINKASNIRSAGYDRGSFTLEVEFSTGDIYEYYNVPPQIVESFLARDKEEEGKPGSFFYHNIRTSYTYKRIKSGKDGDNGTD